MALDDRCIHNVSDDDCYKCMKYGIIFSCPPGCKYFEDERYKEPEEKQQK